MQILTTFFVGIAMGIADLVPGVSGGTIAFIAGIYENLLSSIHSIDKKFFNHIKKGKIIKAWNHINGKFLLTLVSGIFVSVFLGAIGLSSLLDNHPDTVFSFFSGLIIASAVWFLYIHFSFRFGGWALVGGLLGRLITTTTGIGFSTTYLGFFFAGVLGSSAMILPGISGSYILLIIGMYEPVLGLITGFTSGDLSVIPMLGSLFLGIGSGIILLGRILKKLYMQYPAQLILCMTGLMIGALPSIVPTQALLGSDGGFLGTLWLALGGGILVFYGLSLLSKKTDIEISE